jgi:uncharacterized protein YecE (DUF72 family)
MDKHEVDIAVGVTGWNRDDWRGAVYPETLGEGERLSYLADPLGLDVVDLEETWKKEPDPAYYQRLLEVAPDGPAFVVRVPAELTGALRDDRGDFVRNEWAAERFVASLAPLIAADRLRFALAVFPAKLTKSDAAITHLRWFIGRLRPYVRLAVEFGHESWGTPSTYALLEEAGASWVATDRPGVAGGTPFAPVATSPDGVVRLLGRSDRWFTGTGADRYRYTYPEFELRGFLEPLSGMKKKITRLTILFSNGTDGACVTNARTLSAALKPDGVDE